MVLAQWYIPAQMIVEQQRIIKRGTPYLFQLRPVDPTDYFRGKYITLSYREDKGIRVEKERFNKGMPVYACVSKDSLGYAVIDSVSLTIPDASIDYFETEVSRVYQNYKQRESEFSSMRIKFSFNRFYMEESKAPIAERKYNEVARDSTINIAGKVYLYEGKTQLDNVLIDGVPIADWVMEEK